MLIKFAEHLRQIQNKYHVRRRYFLRTPSYGVRFEARLGLEQAVQVLGVADGWDKEMERVEKLALDVLGRASRCFVAHMRMLGCRVASISLQ